MVTVLMIFKVTQICKTYYNRILWELKCILSSTVFYFCRMPPALGLMGKMGKLGWFLIFSFCWMIVIHYLLGYLRVYFINAGAFRMLLLVSPGIQAFSAYHSSWNLPTASQRSSVSMFLLIATQFTFHFFP